MTEWKEIKIKDVCDLGRGRVISSIEIGKNPGIYPVYSSQSQNNGEMGRINTYDFEGDYVTWTTDGAYAGTVFFRNGKFNCTNVCGTLKAKDENEINHQFLAYKLSTIAKKYVSYIGNPKLMNNTMGAILFEIPSDIDEQRCIAHILNTIDIAIANAQKLIAKHKRIKIGLIQDLLTKGIDKDGNLRSEPTHEFKDSPMGRIPVEWDVKSIGEIVIHLGSGVTPKGGSKVYQKDGVLLIRSQNVYHDFLLLDDVAFVSDEINERMQRSQIFEFDVLLNITGASIGRCSIVPKSFPKANVNQHVCALRLDNNSESRAYFLQSFLSSVYGQNQIFRLNAGGNREGLNYSQTRAITLPWPSSDLEFEQIKDRILAARKFINSIESNLTKLQSLKTGLMQDLLSGNVRVDMKNINKQHGTKN